MEDKLEPSNQIWMQFVTKFIWAFKKFLADAF